MVNWTGLTLGQDTTDVTNTVDVNSVMRVSVLIAQGLADVEMDVGRWHVLRNSVAVCVCITVVATDVMSVTVT